MVMNEPTLESPSERFDRLERQNWRLVSGLLVVLVVVAALLSAGMTGKKPSYRGKRIYAYVLALTGKENARAGFWVDSERAALNLFGSGTAIRATLEGHDIPLLRLEIGSKQEASISAWSNNGKLWLTDYERQLNYHAPPL